MSSSHGFPPPSRPDPAHFTIGPDGLPWYRFEVVFEADGAEFGTSIWAHNMADAERRIQALKGTARLGGQVLSRVAE